MNIPEECPTCATGGVKSAVKLYQLNLDEAAVFCENLSCPFPLFSLNVCPLVIPHKLGTMSSLHSQEKWNKKSTDTESNSSSCSVSSWASGTSTLSSISSSVATPPPPISSRPFTNSIAKVNPSSTLVYKPKPVSLQPKGHVFNWNTPISSAQTSPASSIDIEVEQAMKNHVNMPNSFSAPTPSPSPLTSHNSHQQLNQENSDEIDSYIAESLMFFGEGSSQPDLFKNCEDIAPNQSSVSIFETPPTENLPILDSSATLTEFPTLKNSVQSCVNKSNSSDLNPTAVSRPIIIRKRAVKRKTVELYPSTSPLDECSTTRPIRALLPKKAKKDEIVSLIEPLLQSVEPVVQKSHVEVDLDEEGTPVKFTIIPSTPKPPAQPPVKKKPTAAVVKQKEPIVEEKSEPKKTRAKKTAPTTATKTTKTRKPKAKSTDSESEPTEKPTKRPAKKGGFCLDSLVSSFVQMANKKKLPPKNS